jgi:tRNA/rRNA methyltransferase
MGGLTAIDAGDRFGDFNGPTLAQPFMSGNPQPLIILVEPQLGENIGMCARAMLNCGLDRLRLERPRDGWPNAAAIATAADADGVLEKVEVFATLAGAIADCHHVVATSARDRSIPLPVLRSGEAVERIGEWTDQGAEVAIVCGPESSGLDNEAIARAEWLMRFETNPEFSSLNLAQSVLLFGWEWKSRQSTENGGPARDAGTVTANRAELESFFERLEKELDLRGFFLTPDLKPTTLKSLRSLFSRTAASEREVKLLQGMLTALLRRRRDEATEEG